MGYDPVVEITQGSTYADDLAGLVVGIEETLRLRYLLLAASHAAGLKVATHTCVTVHVRAIHPALRRALRRSPVVC
eukprot:11168507-Lingulodinium_polyedra.AAC.1